MKSSASLSFAAGRIRRGGLAISSALPIRTLAPTSVNQRYIKWYTLWLSRKFEMFVFCERRGLDLNP